GELTRKGALKLPCEPDQLLPSHPARPQSPRSVDRWQSPLLVRRPIFPSRRFPQCLFSSASPVLLLRIVASSSPFNSRLIASRNGVLEYSSLLTPAPLHAPHIPYALSNNAEFGRGTKIGKYPSPLHGQHVTIVLGITRSGSRVTGRTRDKPDQRKLFHQPC